MAKDNGDTVETLEKGSIYFFCPPRVGQEEPQGLEDIQRLHMILSVDGKRSYRLILIGRKRLPDPAKAGKERIWGFVDAVSSKAKEIEDTLDPQKYETKTRGERERPAARPVGEGRYRVVRHGNHTHLVYALELPRKPGEVQEDVQIEEEASYILSIKNPEKGSPRAAGLKEERQAKYPKKLQEVFRDRRFGEADPPDFLDYEGTEIMLVAASDDIEEELGLKLDTERETASSADIYKDLRMEKSVHPTKPLFEGKWE